MTAPRPRALTLFTGIAGWDIALVDAGADIVAASEVAEYPSRVLALRQPDVPNLGDVRGVDGSLGTVDVIAGGFPCQDLSRAGKGAGLRAARSGLWSEFLRLIDLYRPSLVLVENVPPLRDHMPAFLGDLLTVGYDCEWDGIPAAAAGAPHLRDRIWIAAYPAGTHGPAIAFGGPRSLMPVDADEAAVRGMRAGIMRDGNVWELEPLYPLSRYRRLGTDDDPQWATPTARDHKDTGDNTNYAAAAAKGKLSGQVVQHARGLWPTPKASPSGPDYARMNRPRSGGDDLATAVARVDVGPLHPTWQDWLMGFPPGWTDVTIATADLPAHDWAAEPLPRTGYDVPDRVGRLTATGNALVPAVASLIASPALHALRTKAAA